MPEQGKGIPVLELQTEGLIVEPLEMSCIRAPVASHETEPIAVPDESLELDNAWFFTFLVHLANDQSGESVMSLAFSRGLVSEQIVLRVLTT